MKFAFTAPLLFCCLALSTALPRVEFPLSGKSTGSVASTSATDLSPTILPTKAALRAKISHLARRESWEDVSGSIICNTFRKEYRDRRAGPEAIEQGSEYLWNHGEFWTVRPNFVDRTPNPIRIAFTRIADLAREIRIGCYGVDEHVNGEVTGKDGVTVVVAASNC
ncbi:hypothetical protein MMC31_004534 [Peltigera leucophlebia]|nr:hypothetical protein [Peltigera leucophlebia]